MAARTLVQGAAFRVLTGILEKYCIFAQSEVHYWLAKVSTKVLRKN